MNYYQITLTNGTSYIIDEQSKYLFSVFKNRKLNCQTFNSNQTLGPVMEISAKNIATLSEFTMTPTS